MLSIKEFEYLDIAINELNDKYDSLEESCIILEEVFSDILNASSCEFTNISCRVKSSDSLREKILRNRYYKRYPKPDELIYNLSDLIGIRIECKLGDDEKSIYRFLKDLMNSIKNSLTMIDNQLLTVLNHVESKNNKDSTSRKKHLEEVV